MKCQPMSYLLSFGGAALLTDPDIVSGVTTAMQIGYREGDVCCPTI